MNLPTVMPFSWACAYGEDRIGLWQAFEVNGVRQVLRWIAPGKFQMGSPEVEMQRFVDEHQHWVTLTRGYWLADTACTQELWEAVLNENPSMFKDDPQNPVERVSWDEVVERFLPALNKRVPGLKAELPSEAQWEYACRAGTETPFCFGEQITPEQVNYNGNRPYGGGEKTSSLKKTLPVKALPANRWGFYQMHGNVWEWCADWHTAYPKGPAVDPKELALPHGQSEGKRVLRGGSWGSRGRYCRSAHRSAYQLGGDPRGIGFRLVQSVC